MKINTNIMLQLNSKTAKILYSLAACVLLMVVYDQAWRVTALLGLHSASLSKFIVGYSIMFIAVIILTLFVVKPKELFSFLGISGNIAKGFFISLICVLPLYVIFPILGSFNSYTTLSLILRKSVFPGFMEEFMFRAFMFGLLFRYAKTGFFWAVILPALLFGFIHLYQGHDVVSSLAAFGVTFIGAVYFSWMYVEWNFNLWVPVGLHMLMNGAWVIFSMEGTEVAAGGLISNIVRIASILLAVAITVWYKKRNATKVFCYPVWQF